MWERIASAIRRLFFADKIGSHKIIECWYWLTPVPEPDKLSTGRIRDSAIHPTHRF